jgi:hypothetical protein
MSLNSIKEQLISMISREKIEYINFDKNPTLNILYNYYSNEENNRTLFKINNFLIKSQEESVISFRCIINNQIIKIPARTIYCNHIECLDLEILFNTILKLGQCPLCQTFIENNIKIGVDSIYIDDYLLQIYNKNFKNRYDNSYEYLILSRFTKKVRPYDPRISQEKLEILEVDGTVGREGTREIFWDEELDTFNKIVGADEYQINLTKLLK